MELTTIIERYRNRFDQQYGLQTTHQLNRAIDAVLDCRSERYGKMLLHCPPCNNQQSYFHACGNRSCHRCQNHDTTRWLERQAQKLLPVEYFMVTFTLPYELRAFTWQHQKSVYTILFDCAVSTLKQFGINDYKLGSELAMTAVLHTHTRRLDLKISISSHAKYACQELLIIILMYTLSYPAVVSTNNDSSGINSKASLAHPCASRHLCIPAQWKISL